LIASKSGKTVDDVPAVEEPVLWFVTRIRKHVPVYTRSAAAVPLFQTLPLKASLFVDLKSALRQYRPVCYT
jgi:hypothetical protein